MSLVDSHCHLNFNVFETDRNDVLARAEQAGVIRCVIPALDLQTCREVLGLTALHSALFAAVGVHPNEALSWSQDTLEQLRGSATNPTVVAVGEIGLDYYWDKAPRDHQQWVLQQQLDLARELVLPVIIHNRAATEDLLEILEAWSATFTIQNSPLANRLGVLHAFSADMETAQRAIELGFYIGIAGPITYKKADQLREIVVQIPLERMLVETDAPFLTPHPHRGARNEPAYVCHTAAKVAQIRNMPEAEIASQTTKNAFRLFNW